MVRSTTWIVLSLTIIIYSYNFNVLLYTTEFKLNEVKASSLWYRLRQYANRVGSGIPSHRQIEGCTIRE